jgi:hypothetical protein
VHFWWLDIEDMAGALDTEVEWEVGVSHLFEQEVNALVGKGAGGDWDVTWREGDRGFTKSND